MVLELPLDVADEVATSFQWRDKVLVITKRGTVFLLTISDIDGLPLVEVTQR